MPSRVPRSWSKVLGDDAAPKAKYRNKPVVIGGRRFASIKEGNRALLLRQWEREGKISGLEFQPEFKIEVYGHTICRYFGDFAYMKDGKKIIEDCKSEATKTPVYRIKRKLMLAVHGIEVLET